jgi:hypothetical protein
MNKLKLFVIAAALALTAWASSKPAFGLLDGGPIFLCPPGSKTCRCTVTSCK